jgi:hypothetical protein
MKNLLSHKSKYSFGRGIFGVSMDVQKISDSHIYIYSNRDDGEEPIRHEFTIPEFSIFVKGLNKILLNQKETTCNLVVYLENDEVFSKIIPYEPIFQLHHRLFLNLSNKELKNVKNAYKGYFNELVREKMLKHVEELQQIVVRIVDIHYEYDNDKFVNDIHVECEIDLPTDDNLN